MNSTKLISTEQLIKDWNDFVELFKKEAQAARVILLHHNSQAEKNEDRSKPGDIINAKIALEKINKLKEQLNTFDNSWKKTYLQKMIDEVSLKQFEMSSYIIELNKIIADKYSHLTMKCLNRAEKCTPLTLAYQYISTAFTLKKEMMANYPNQVDDPYLEGAYKDIKSMYHSFVEPDKIDPNDVIGQKLRRARNCKNKDEAYDRFQDAINHAKKINDPLLQFEIVLEQGSDYLDLILKFDRHINQIEINHRQTVLRKIGKCFVDAINLIPQIKNADTNIVVVRNGRGMYHDVLYIAEKFFELSTFSCIKKDLKKREDLINESLGFYQYGIQLAMTMKIGKEEEKKEYTLLKDKITKAQQSIQNEKEEIENKQRQSKEEKDSISELQIEYDKKFNELLNSYPSNKKNSKKNHGASSKYIGSHIAENEDETLNVDEEELLQPIYISAAQLGAPPKVSHTSMLFSAEKSYLEQLELASKSNDPLKQIKAHSDIAEYYRLHALRYTKQNLDQIANAIGYFEKAKNHLTKANELIMKEKKINSNNKALMKLEEGVAIILGNTQSELKHTIKRQQEWSDYLENIHDKIKKSIIATKGKKKWFKFKKYDWDKLSDEAKLRITAKNNLEQLKIIGSEVHQLSQHVNIPKKIVYKKFVEMDFCEARAIDRNNNKNLFFQQKEQLRLTRTLSCDSFFDPVDSSNRFDVLKAGGRK